MAAYLVEVRRAGLYCDVVVEVGGPGWEATYAAHRVIIAQSDFFRARLRWDSEDPIRVWIDGGTRDAFEDVMGWLYSGTFETADEDRWVSRIAVARFLGVHAAVDASSAMLIRASTALDGLGRALKARDVARFYMLPDLEMVAFCSMRASIALAVASLDVRVPGLLRRIDAQDMCLLLNDAWFANDEDRTTVADLWALANRRPSFVLNCNEGRLGFAFDLLKTKTALPVDAHVDGHTLHLGCDRGVVTASLIVRSLPCPSSSHVSLRCFHARGTTVYIDTVAFTEIDDQRCVSTPVKCFDLRDLPKYANFGTLLIALTMLEDHQELFYEHVTIWAHHRPNLIVTI